VVAALGGSGLGVAVGLKYYDGADWQKGLLACAMHSGLILAPLAVNIVARFGFRVSRATAVLTAMAVPGMIVAALSQTLNQFILGLYMGAPFLGALVPLVTALWRQNARRALRGRAFSEVGVVAAAVALAAGIGITWAVSENLGRYRIVFGIFAGAILVGAFASWRIPSRPLESNTRRNPFAGLSLLWRDRFFGYMCAMQMLLGFANLATIPLRIEFVGSGVRGLGYEAGMILLLTLVIPLASRLPAMLVWGRLFDRVNFIVIRICVNVFFIASIAMFFQKSLMMQIAGSVCFGIATGGGGVAWSLWVTKFAPAEKTADYMSVHTFLTGCRAFVAPQLAFATLAVMSIQQASFIGIALIVIAIAMLLPVIHKLGSHGRHGVIAAGADTDARDR
jgi:MFS family permease